MRALTIKQPWAELIMLGVKDVENRSVGCNYRGKIAVHVSKQRAPGSDIDHDLLEDAKIWQAYKSIKNAGQVIGTVVLVDCVRDSGSEWAIPGRWHWVLASPRRYRNPIDARGMLGLWEWTR